jgi:hypothetical protein
MSKRSEIKKEYHKQYGSCKGDGKYSDHYVGWLEDQLLSLREGQSEQLVCVHPDSSWVYDESGVDMYCKDCEKEQTVL